MSVVGQHGWGNSRWLFSSVGMYMDTFSPLGTSKNTLQVNLLNIVNFWPEWTTEVFRKALEVPSWDQKNM